jgi:hypothetical protein
MTDDPAAIGTALAALMLQTQILHTLIRTGTLPKPLMVAMMDAAVLTVEEMPPDEGFSPEAIAFARKRLLDVQRLVEGASPTTLP